MDKDIYLKKLSFIVRWRLPKAEADEVLADYAEILSQRPTEDFNHLVKEMGKPIQAARLLTEPKAYRRWLVAFTLMTTCILLPEAMLLWARRGGWSSEEAVVVLLLSGIIAALLWFRPIRGEKKKPLPQKLLPALAVLLMVPMVAGAILWGLALGVWETLPARFYGIFSTWVLCIAGTATAIISIWGLFKARTSDRRWRALYVLGLTALAECTLVMLLLSSMSLDSSLPNWWVEYVLRGAAVGGVGLVGTGVSLC